MFNRDLLLIDEEYTGVDPNKHELIQLAAVWLDKTTLKEKKHFSTYIKPRHWRRRQPEAMAVNNIPWETLQSAPSLTAAITKFHRTFPKNVVLTYYVGVNDIVFLMNAYRQAGLKFPFDYHYFNIWGLFWPYLARQKKLTSKEEFAGFGLGDLLAHFKIPMPPGDLHDALVDCRVEAEILRRVLRAQRGALRGRPS